MAAQPDADFELAMLDAYSALVRVLDRNGVVRAQDVDALHGAAEVRRQDGDTEVSSGLHRLRNKLVEEVSVGHPPLKVA